MNSVTDFLTILINLIADLATVWSPLLLIAVLVVVGVQVLKMVRLARTNASTRARRREAQAHVAAQNTLAA